MNLMIAGLVFDIVGAVLVAKSFFLMSPQTLTDFGYRYASNDAVEFYGANVIGLKLREQYQVRIGLCLLVFGFFLQIISNSKGSIYAYIILSLSVIFASLTVCWVVYRHKKIVFETAVELVDRMFYRKSSLPSGMDPYDVYTAILLVKSADRTKDVRQEDKDFTNRVLAKQATLRQRATR